MARLQRMHTRKDGVVVVVLCNNNRVLLGFRDNGSLLHAPANALERVLEEKERRVSPRRARIRPVESV